MSVSTSPYLGEINISIEGIKHHVEIYRSPSGMLVGVDSRWTGSFHNPETGETPAEGTVAVVDPYNPAELLVLDPEHVGVKTEGADVAIS